MPVQDGFYEQLTVDEIRNALESELQVEFGEDIDLTESSVFTTLAQVLATVLHNNQEQSLQDVYESAFLDTATGQALDDVVSIIGLRRRDAIHATGVERFTATGPVEQDYPIQSGTTVQTGGGVPIEFETTEPTALELIDSFESNDLSMYSGNVANASIVADANSPQGDNALELDATDGAHIYNDDITVQRGTTFHAWFKPTAGTAPAITFAVQPTEPDTYYQVVVDEGADEVRIEYVLNGAVDTVIDTLSTAGITAGEYQEVEINWATTANIGITLYNPNGDELGTAGAENSELLEGHPGFKSEDATGTKRIDWYTTSAVSANIRSLVGGVNGNVGSNSINRLPSPPAGVNTATNLYPTGTTDYQNTNGFEFAIGTNRENDTQLRNRAQDAVAGGGAATHDAIVSELVNNTDGVTSVTVFENKTGDDNTSTGGLPPHSFEAIVFGGEDDDVAESIFDKKAVTSRDYSGVNGTSVQVTVTATSNGQSRQIEFSRPVKVDVDLTLDLVIDDSYIGDDALRDEIVSYIGGTLSEGTEVVGLGVSDDVRIDALRDLIVGDDTGVIGFDQSVDGSPIETTPSFTTVDGLEVIDIGGNEVAQSDAADASITLNTRQI